MRPVVLAGLSLALVGLIGVFGAGEVLSRPVRRVIGAAPSGLQAESVQFAGAGSQAVAGWLAPGRPGAGAVLLLHGVRGDRLEMLERALFLHAEGYSVLLVDLPAHGESGGRRIGFGVHEGEGVRAALDFLRARMPGERIGVIGVSLGAAALVLAHPRPAPDAAILESMYPTIEEAVEDRLAIHLGPAGRMLAPLLLFQLPLRLGVQASQLRPIDHIAGLRCPLLIVSGTEDRHTTWPESERLFGAAAEPKELWPVAGAAHQDLLAFAPAAYRQQVLRFFAARLRGPATGLRGE